MEDGNPEHKSETSTTCLSKRISSPSIIIYDEEIYHRMWQAQRKYRALSLDSENSLLQSLQHFSAGKRFANFDDGIKHLAEYFASKTLEFYNQGIKNARTLANIIDFHEA
ncbi:hypothetical protein KIN20_010206 [Parelaphostrongylus tenuis]|uniref:Uncharacterized protein n=1 Tax=Parelaphostrongylus tenuis TaxID=148309 RepID=A0AAD5MRL1_PARTN|nr:hypothetical protein KIN20_010206 [Parelaphostrongylus tenuis]